MSRTWYVAAAALVLASACHSAPPRGLRSPTPIGPPTSPSAASSPPAPIPSGSTAAASGFLVDDVSFVSPDHGFALGHAYCRDAPCTLLLESTDGARHWRTVSRVPATAGDPACGSGVCVTALRFVTPRIGYAFGPSLLMTLDGGRTWRVQTGAEVSSLEGDSRTVLRVATGAAGCAGQRARLEISAPGSARWTSLQRLASDDICPPKLYREGRDRVLLVSYGNPAGGVAPTATLYTSTDQGRHLTRHDDPCVPPGGGDSYTSDIALAPGDVMTAVCGSHDPAKHALRSSTDGGLSFGAARPLPADITSRGDAPLCGIAAASAQRLLVLSACGPHVTDLFTSQNGGATWAPPELYGPGAMVLVGFEDPLTARVAQNDEIRTTADGGRTWRSDTFLPE